MEIFLNWTNGDKIDDISDISQQKRENNIQTKRIVQTATKQENRRSKEYKSKRSRKISIKLRYNVFKRDNFRCRLCGRSPATDPSIILHVDHIKPWRKDGETTMENLRTLCADCNIGKSDSD